jgi:hypothetical protein
MLDSAGVFASLANRLLLRSAEPSAKQIAFWDKILMRTSRALDPWSTIALAKVFSPGGQ